MSSELYPAAAWTPARAGAREGGTVRPLRAWSAADREGVSTAIADAQRAWVEAWGLTGRAPRGEGAPAAGAAPTVMTPFEPGWVEHAAPSPGWRERWPSAWWAFDAPHSGSRPPPEPDGEPHLDALCAALFGAAPRWTSSRAAAGGARAPGGTVAEAVATASWNDWCARIAGALRCEGGRAGEGERRNPAAPLLAPWSGSLLVSVPWVDGTMRLLVGAERVEARARAGRPADVLRQGRPPTTPVWRAAARRTVALRVAMEPFEVEVGALAGLRVGDVIRTEHRLDVPVAVSTGDGAGAPICTGHLGRLEGRRAVELFALSPPPQDLRAGLGAARRATNSEETTR